MVVRSRSCVGLKGCAVLRDCCVRTHVRDQGLCWIAIGLRVRGNVRFRVRLYVGLRVSLFGLGLGFVLGLR